jgi:hypothetical protein
MTAVVTTRRVRGFKNANGVPRPSHFDRTSSHDHLALIGGEAWWTGVIPNGFLA